MSPEPPKLPESDHHTYQKKRPNKTLASEGGPPLRAKGT